MECLQREDPPSTLGEYWLAMQGSMAQSRIDPVMFWLLDQADGTKGQVPLAAQRPEHVEMWTLLGDPALKLPIERSTLEFDVNGDLLPGGRISITARVPDDMNGGTARVCVEPRILRLLKRSDDEDVVSSGPAMEPPLAANDVQLESGQLQCTLELPKSIDSTREFVVRIVISNGDKHLSGHRPIARKIR
jgi:hypothetical protein